MLSTFKRPQRYNIFIRYSQNKPNDRIDELNGVVCGGSVYGVVASARSCDERCTKARLAALHRVKLSFEFHLEWDLRNNKPWIFRIGVRSCLLSIRLASRLICDRTRKAKYEFRFFVLFFLQQYLSSQAFCVSYFDHFALVPGDPMDKLSNNFSFHFIHHNKCILTLVFLCRTIVLRPLEPSPPAHLAREFLVKTRRRKGLSEDVAVNRYFDDAMLAQMAALSVLQN